jgi:putative ABC transport system permease protein
VRTLLTVTLRSLLWRRWATLGLLVAAVTSFAAAAVGPLWANAAEDSLLAQTFPRDDLSSSLVHVTANGNQPASGVIQIPAFAVQEAEAAIAMPEPLDASFSRPHTVLSTSGRVLVRGRHGATALAGMTWTEGGCDSLVLVDGSCPRADADVAVSARTAATTGVQVGSVVRVAQLASEPPAANTGTPFPSVLRVVGVYRPPAEQSRRWAGDRDLFSYAAGIDDPRDPVPPRTETMFTTRPLLERLALTPVTASSTRFLALPDLRADRVDAVAAELAGWDGERRSEHGSVILLDKPLDAVRAVVGQRDAVRLASWLVSLQLLALVWYVLFLMTAAAAESRSHDVALAKLRGLRPRLVTLLGVLEPIVVVLLALPLGLLLAVAAVRAAAGGLLPGDPGLRLADGVATAMLVALTGSCVAGALAVRRTVRERVLLQLQGGRRVWVPRGLLLGETVVVVLSAAALWQVWARQDDGQLDGLVLLAPGLAAAGVGVLAARLLRVASLLWARSTRHRPRSPAFLASRHVGRREHGTRAAVFAAVAVSLAVFAACSWGLGERQREGQAAMDVGADRVYQVRADSAAAVLAAVRRVDPHGRHLAAAAQLDTGIASASLLAVDTTRLRSVTAWQPDWGQDADQVSRVLRPRTAPSVVVSGSGVDVDLEVHSSLETSLVASLVDDVGREHPASAPLRDGRQTAHLELAHECARGCRLVGLTFVRQPKQVGILVGSAYFTRLSLTDGAEVADAFSDGRWRSSRLNERSATSTTTSKLDAMPHGLFSTFNVGPIDVAGLVSNDSPEGLPLLATPGSQFAGLGRDDLVTATALDGGSTIGRVVGSSAVLPRIGDVGGLADLELAIRAARVALPSLQLQVWADKSAPSRTVLARELAAHGVRIVGTETIAERRAELDRTGPALALLLLLGMAAAALVVAALAVIALALVQGRARAYETAALSTAGVRDGMLRRAAWWEYGVQLATGTAAGVVAGVLATAGLGASVTHLGLTGAVAPVPSSLPPWWLAAVVGTALVCFGLVSAACAGMTVRAARPEMLRGVSA